MHACDTCMWRMDVMWCDILWCDVLCCDMIPCDVIAWNGMWCVYVHAYIWVCLIKFDASSSFPHWNCALGFPQFETDPQVILWIIYPTVSPMHSIKMPGKSSLPIFYPYYCQVQVKHHGVLWWLMFLKNSSWNIHTIFRYHEIIIIKCHCEGLPQLHHEKKTAGINTYQKLVVNIII